MPTLLPPPARFNFAQYLIDSNAARPAKVALIDDAGQLTYGELADQVRRLLAACKRRACAAKTACCC